MSAQDGSWIPVYLLPTRLRHLWPLPPAIGWPWSSRFPTCETCFVRRTFICICHTPALRFGTHFLLTLETVVFLFHLLSTTSKPFSSLFTRLAHAARLGFFYKKTCYINSLLLLLFKMWVNVWNKCYIVSQLCKQLSTINNQDNQSMRWMCLNH